MRQMDLCGVRSTLSPLKVYLAGGMLGDWQDKVMEAVPGPIYFDPRSHGITDEMGYTVWDLAHVDLADVVFIHITRDNPSGYGTMVEAGYGQRAGKYVIFSDEKSLFDERFYRYMGMARSLANYHCFSLSEGITHLRSVVAQPEKVLEASDFEIAKLGIGKL